MPYTQSYSLDDAKLLLSSSSCKSIPTPSLLQDLVQIQHRFGFINAKTTQWLGQQYQQASSYVKGIIDFYHFLHSEFTGQYLIYLSNNITDQMKGADRCYKQFIQAFPYESTNPRVNVSYSSCTGMGDQGPAALINGFPVTNLTKERVDEVISLIQQQKSLSEWPGALFNVEDNIRKAGPLLNHIIKPGSILTKVAKQYNTQPSQFINTVTQSGLRGRGGAGFSTGDKWSACQQAECPKKVIICNADEGEPGTFKDRVLLTSYLDNIIEGMTICAYSIGAQEGYIYLRGEYIYLQPQIEQHLQQRRQQGLLGDNIAKGNPAPEMDNPPPFNFDIYVHIGAGAYICGEESALIESMEGKRGIPRIRPPYPVTHGYLQRPTVVNNVETFCCITWIADHSAEEFLQQGSPDNAGTKLHSVSGDCEQPGIYELPMGTPVHHLVSLCGSPESLTGAQVGGPSGRFVTSDQFDLAMDYNQVSTGGSFMTFDSSRKRFDITENFTRFFQHESCGFCTSCRVGTTILAQHLEDIRTSSIPLIEDKPRCEELHSLATLINNTSHCGLGHTAGNPVLQHVQHQRPNNTPPGALSNSKIKPVFNLDLAQSDLCTAGRNKNNDNT